MNARTIVISTAAALGAALLIAAGAQPAATPPPEPDAPTPGAQQARPQAQDMGSMLIQGLKDTEGCLGIETPQFPDGRQSIMAWFENKAAVKRWYYSQPHQFFMGAVGGSDREPLAHVEDETIPIMVIATIDFTGPPAAPGPIPFSSISIELYTPLPGGAFVSKRLAPEGFEVEHMRDFTQSGYQPSDEE